MTVIFWIFHNIKYIFQGRNWSWFSVIQHSWHLRFFQMKVYDIFLQWSIVSPFSSMHISICTICYLRWWRLAEKWPRCCFCIFSIFPNYICIFTIFSTGNCILPALLTTNIFRRYILSNITEEIASIQLNQFDLLKLLHEAYKSMF